MKKILLALMLLATPAWATDMPVKVAPVAGVPDPCTTSQCTGWYVGGGFAGNGTNADILGNGISGSVFAAGAIPFVNGGWQYWNGKLFLAAEVGVGDQLNIGGLTGNETGVLGYQEVQFGGTLSGILGTNSAPVTVPTVLSADLISLYVAMGVIERSFANGWETGAGAKFAIAPHLFLDIGYRYANYGVAAQAISPALTATYNNENLVRISVNYKF
jgi:opacity protein-like surface antigen